MKYGFQFLLSLNKFIFYFTFYSSGKRGGKESKRERHRKTETKYFHLTPQMPEMAKVRVDGGRVRNTV